MEGVMEAMEKTDHGSIEPIAPASRPRVLSLAAGLRHRILGISSEEADFSRRGFPDTGAVKQTHLEQIGRAFVAGYTLAIGEDDLDRLATALLSVEPRDLDGFRFEGAAMALHLRDALSPVRRDRWRRFLRHNGDHYAHLLHVGPGWALARLRRPVARFLRRTDPLLGWLAVDGYGFHQGYFQPDRYLIAPFRLAPFPGYARRVFDQGLGRSLWFYGGADVDRIVGRVAGFPPDRQDDLWSGLGLAATYAGGCDPAELDVLARTAGRSRGHLLQGVVFGATARHRAGNVPAHTTAACHALVGMDAERAAELAEAAQVAAATATPTGDGRSYEAWRAGIRRALPGSAGGPS